MMTIGIADMALMKMVVKGLVAAAMDLSCRHLAAQDQWGRTQSRHTL